VSEFQILGAATLKLREPNDVWTNGAVVFKRSLKTFLLQQISHLAH